MCIRKPSRLLWLFVLPGMLLALAVTPQAARAEPAPPPEPGTCLNCHENLYFLHDTGKWFCLRAAPMACVDCHGGDPTAITQEQAHAQRAAHPILNEDTTKCLECHPAQTDERVQIFREVAGLSPVRVAAAYVPVLGMASTTQTIEPEPAASLFPWTTGIGLGLLAVLVLLTILITKSRH